MKTKLLILATFAIVACMVYAQTDDSSYLNKAMERLEAGDCAGAQKMYNVYKDITGKSLSSVEVLIKDCSNSTEKKYNIGDVLLVGDEKYTIAYIRDGGIHGLAVANLGWKTIADGKTTYVTRKGIPTLDELKLIYANKDKLRLYDKYWTCTPTGDNEHFMIIDFSTGTEESSWQSYGNAIILLIHRF